MLKEGIYMATGKQFGTVPFQATVKAARLAATEGMVLLKNNDFLPMKPCKIALFGAGSIDTTICGTGSGYAFSPYKVTIEEGLKKAGFEIAGKSWKNRYLKAKKEAEKENKLSVISKRWSGVSILIDPPVIEPSDLNECGPIDTAIYVIIRNTGEGSDRTATEGDYYLSDAEKQNLRILTGHFKNLVVILNTCVIDATELLAMEGISAILSMGQAGMEAGNALADIITGKVCPSGRLTDTWAMQYPDYPASATFSTNDGDTSEERYEEGIYVGYRYFDTKDMEVVYPFGYGLSYSTFSLEVVGMQADWNEIRVNVRVKNTGNAAAKEVVQLYVSAPQGKLDKPYQELKSYGKTKCLLPGASGILTLTCATESLASYSEEDAAWMMESGEYIIRIGDHSRNTAEAGRILVDADTNVRQVSNQMTIDKPMEVIRMSAPEKPQLRYQAQNTKTTVRGGDFAIKLMKADCITVDNISRIPKEVVTYIPEGSDYDIPERRYEFPFPLKERIEYVRNCPDAVLSDVKEGKVTMEEFVASLDVETLLRIVTGVGNETKYEVPKRRKGLKKNKIGMACSGKTTGQYMESLGIPQMGLCDGPAGLHLMGSNCTAFPVGMIAAQTWNKELVRRIGDTYALELEKYHVHIALGPGMNIHRDPLCGRNFEYYSEDPYLTGKTAAAFTRGLQEGHPHTGVSLKHFACNNQEIDRVSETSQVTERALREIYLKGFEICVREAKPKTVMSSYNCINGIHTSSRYDLLTDILRGEWGFDGLVMTDWDSQSEKPYDLHAGNDIIMGGYRTELLKTAIDGTGPEFDPDGSVYEKEVAAYGGFFKNKIVKWNAFVPSADGPDAVSTIVAAGTELGERAKEASASGLAVIEELADGSKKVTYRGVDRGQWLPIGDLQKCAMNVLTTVMNTAEQKLRAKNVVSCALLQLQS